MLKLDELSDYQRRLLIHALTSYHESLEAFIFEGCTEEEEDDNLDVMEDIDDLIELIDDKRLWEEEKPHLTLIKGGKS